MAHIRSVTKTVLGGVFNSVLHSAAQQSNTPLFDLNFKTATYSGDTLSNMVAEAANFVGGLYEREDTGALMSVAANAAQVSANGLEVWASRTNVALQSRNLTTTWTLTGCTAARSTGRNGSANQGSRVTVTTNGGTAVLPATVLASNTYTGAVDIARVSGTGGVEMSIDGGATWVSLAGITGTFKRISIPSQVVTNPQTQFRFATAGDVFDIDYVTCQTGAILGPRVATTTASVNVPQNRLTCLNKPPIVNFIKGGVYAVYWEGRMNALGGRGIFVSDNNFNITVAADGSIAWGGGLPAGTFQFGVYQKVVITRQADGKGYLYCNGAKSAGATMSGHASLTHFDWATNGAGAFNCGGVIRRTAFYSALTDAEAFALIA
ncbi:hypothetical protein X747_14505 [Mesorhizobium sp. LNJC384A00]|uniref:hypothetical protein n=1 Tax=Mesorhizobium sp. LNJC384A00 TaxID=1287268 RepID=UPI0003CF81C7|nr:hypothetical protein [Mesorhizobium sp. LNJC384A00]ESY42012.1 hypothetical protein X747_14505 [Mesorhizobium sp. LNJC384A00]